MKYGYLATLGIRAMPPRDTAESHRAATPLELLFDLVTVIAIAAAASELHHAIVHGHIAGGVTHFALAFFAIWWAWMNYTWFASAYDNDDVAFRLLTMLVMAGALALAAGIRPFFTTDDLRFVVLGFVVMRIGMVLFWLRAARHHRERRRTTLAYALGIALAQVFWVGIVLWQPMPLAELVGLYCLGIVVELLVPVIAERFGTTPWHRHHMIERYGLLNIIVLGETLLGGSLALAAMANGGFSWDLLRLVAASLVILFSLWWLYFSKEEPIRERSFAMAFIWGYGHLMIYIGGAAVGAGFAVMVDVTAQVAHLSPAAGRLSIALPASLYLLGLWLVRDRYIFAGASQLLLPGFALLVPFVGYYLPLEALALLLVLCVVIRSHLACVQFAPGVLRKT